MQTGKSLVPLTLCLFIFGQAGFFGGNTFICDRWQLGGASSYYAAGIDKKVLYSGKPSLYMEAGKTLPKDFAMLFQSFKADEYLGKKVRFSANIKSEKLGYGGLMLRTIVPGQILVGFKKASFNSSQWKKYQFTMEVPEDSRMISIGLFSDGSGKVWMNGLKLEVVGDKAATDKESIIDVPLNNDTYDKLPGHPVLESCRD